MRPLLILCILAAAAPAYAQLSLNRFEPTPAGDRLFGVSSGGVGDHLTFGARIMPDWAHNPLVLHDDRRVRASVVQNQVFAHMGLSFSAWQRLLLSIDMPLALQQNGSSPNGIASPSGVAAGELRFGARVRLFTAWDGLLTVSVGGYLWVPTSSASYATDGSVRGKAELILSGERGRFFWAAATGVDLRRRQQYLDVAQGSMLRVNVGAGVLLLSERQLQIGPELTAAVNLQTVNRFNMNAEALLGARYRFLNHVEVGVGGGAGLFTGIGTPDFRVVASLGYTFTFGRDKPILVEQKPISPAPTVARAVAEAAPAELVLEPDHIIAPVRSIALREQIQFATASDRILKQSNQTLEALLAAIQALPAHQRFRIEGHTDNRGDPSKNRALSEKRARAVVRWLAARGVEANRFESAGFGPVRPLASNQTPSGRFLNRRVEIHIAN